MAKPTGRMALDETREGRRFVGGRFRILKNEFEELYFVQKKKGWFSWEYFMQHTSYNRVDSFIVRPFKSFQEAEDFIIEQVNKGHKEHRKKQIRVVAEYI